MVKLKWDIFTLKHFVGEIFHNGMLLFLSIEHDDVPKFFGPKLREMIRSYSKGDSFDMRSQGFKGITICLLHITSC